MIDRSAIAAIIFLFNFGIGYSEPGPQVSRLMSQPASMFSFGMYRLEQAIKNNMNSGSLSTFVAPLNGKMDYATGAGYDWDLNRIYIWATRLLKNGNPDWDEEEECRQTIGIIRFMGGVDIDTGGYFKSLQDIKRGSYYGQSFEPIGYTAKADKQTALEIDKIIIIRVQTPELVCTAPLLGTGFSIERN